MFVLARRLQMTTTLRRRCTTRSMPDEGVPVPKVPRQEVPDDKAAELTKKAARPLEGEVRSKRRNQHEVEEVDGPDFQAGWTLQSQKFYFNVVVAQAGKKEGNPKKVKIFGCSEAVALDIFNYTTDQDEYGNVLALKGGRDIIINKRITGKQVWDVKYDVSIRDADRSSQLHKNRLNELHDLSKLTSDCRCCGRVVIHGGHGGREG